MKILLYLTTGVFIAMMISACTVLDGNWDTGTPLDDIKWESGDCRDLELDMEKVDWACDPESVSYDSDECSEAKRARDQYDKYCN